MKIVQSYWSKPVLERGQRRGEDRKRGGWIDIKFHYMSWALSCLSFQKFYPEIQLVTDTFGKSILIDRIGLPYTLFRTDLDHLMDNNTDLWAIAKLHTYLLQTEPFLHVDNDVF